MQSKRKPTAGMPNQRVGDDAVVEMDPAMARNIGVSEGSKVGFSRSEPCYQPN